LGQVQVAVHLIADPHRHAQERPHRRMSLREPARPGIGGQIAPAQRAGVGYQFTAQPAAPPPVTDPGDLGLTPAPPDQPRPPPPPARVPPARRSGAGPGPTAPPAIGRAPPTSPGGLPTATTASSSACVGSLVSRTACSRRCSSASRSSSRRLGSSGRESWLSTSYTCKSPDATP